MTPASVMPLTVMLLLLTASGSIEAAEGDVIPTATDGALPTDQADIEASTPQEAADIVPDGEQTVVSVGEEQQQDDEAELAAAPPATMTEGEAIGIFEEAALGNISMLNPRTFDDWVEAGVRSGHTVIIRFVSSTSDTGATSSAGAWEYAKDRYGHTGPTEDTTVKAILGEVDMSLYQQEEWQSHHVDVESVAADGGCTVWHYNRYTGPEGRHFVASRHHPNGAPGGTTCRHISDPATLEAYILHNIEMSHNRKLWRQEL